jgi:hypothetical protein
MNSMSRPWPPLIIADHPPRWVKSRDHVLTLLMWLVFGLMLESEFELFFGAQFERLGFGDFDTDADWPTFFERLTPFLLVALTLILLLFVASLRTLRRRKLALLLPPPMPLGITEEIRRAGMDETSLIAARAERIVIVQIDHDGKCLIEPRQRYEDRTDARDVGFIL